MGKGNSGKYGLYYIDGDISIGFINTISYSLSDGGII